MQRYQGLGSGPRLGTACLRVVPGLLRAEEEEDLDRSFLINGH
jgi:hypothetical protein